MLRSTTRWSMLRLWLLFQAMSLLLERLHFVLHLATEMSKLMLEWLYLETLLIHKLHFVLRLTVNIGIVEMLRFVLFV